MDKNRMCEVLCALPDGEIIKRRKPMLIPALLLAAGVAMLVVNNLYGATLSNDLRSAVVFMGGSLAIVGFFMLLIRLVGSQGIPFHKGAKSYLQYEELYFEHSARSQVVESIDAGNVSRINSMPRTRVPAVAVAMYRTPDSRFAAMQAFEYADLEYKPLTEIKVIRN